MPNPAAPSDSNAAKLHFLLIDDGGAAAALFRGLSDRAAVLGGSDTKGAPLVVQMEREEGQLLVSGARTATVASATQDNHGWSGVAIFIETTAIAATPSVVPTIEMLDPESGEWFPVASFAAITAVSSKLLMLQPGGVDTLTETDVEIQGLGLSGKWRLRMIHGDADSITYSAGFSHLK